MTSEESNTAPSGYQLKIHELPSNWPQRQDGVSDQLEDLRLIANRLGLHDAADAINQWCEHLPELKYGCYCDLEPGEKPLTDCVLENGEGIGGCIIAKEGMRKEQCKYWRPL